jgi:hypothetical protein
MSAGIGFRSSKNNPFLIECYYMQKLEYPEKNSTEQLSHEGIDDSPYYVFVALCIVVIVVSLINIVASNENIECFREYFAVGYRAPDPSFL